MTAFRFASSDPLDREAMESVRLRSIPRPSLLAEPLDVRHKKTAAALEVLGIDTPLDLLEHLPFRHEDRRDARPIVSLVPGEQATVIGEVRKATKQSGRWGRSRAEATIADDSGVVKAIWFNQPWIADQLEPGARLVLHGRRKDRNQFWVTSHEVAAGVTADDVRAEGMTPVYPATEGITSDRLRELAKRLRGMEGQTVDALPARMRAAEGLPERPAALAAVHFPEDEGETELARRRLAFEELLVLKLALFARKRARREAQAAAVLEATGELVGPWLASLPFPLTADQRAAIETIDADLASGRPMQRLLMGEVGSGKTVVALHAMLRAAENGRQGALMAPTETLAEQHLITLDRLLGGHLPIALLTGSTPAARRREILARLESGELRLVVGTHALIEEPVAFRDLA
ncbi:MAG: ATP-dependent helicase RecG, partial [Thermoleophilaceae bacterium]|nr:ATP-dependent helicase RecG [Thermoleophilaceae bacterium]